MTVVLQDDRFDATNPLRFAPLPPIQLKRRCFAFRSRPTIATVSMLFLDLVDKITTVPKNKLGHRIGHLDAKDMERVNQAILVFLGLIIKTSCPKCMKKIVTSAVRVRGVKGASKRAATHPRRSRRAIGAIKYHRAAAALSILDWRASTPASARAVSD
ncbi:MAG: type II toxin-antitoxin system PemK/MazF family toxin [Xanthobacteraceae bacterium]